MITAALFDYDGTIADTDAIHHWCWNESLARFGLSIDDAFYSAYCSGTTSNEIARIIVKFNPSVLVTAIELALEKDRHFEDWISSEKIVVMPGVCSTLELLKQKGVKIGIVTGAPMTAIEKTLKDNQIFDFFQAIITREKVTHGKPAPEGYRLGLEKLETETHLAVSIEDTISGVLAANAAGMLSIAIPNKYTLSHDFSEADFKCDHMKAACELILK
jgi:beta-phosphoglucomutase